MGALIITTNRKTTGSLVRLVTLTPAPQHSINELISPIKVLWSRVILRALYDYVILKDSRKMKDKREFISVQRWLFDPSDLGNSLENLCKFLNWPVGVIRKKALAMTRDDVKKIEFRERDQVLKSTNNGENR